MQSELMSVQSSVNRFVQVLSRILKLEVEVIDTDMVRVAGTGPYGRDIGKQLHGGTRVLRGVLSTRNHKIVRHAGQDVACEGCSKRENCTETASMGVPLIIGNDILGVINLVCFNQDQRVRLLDNITDLLEYIKGMAQSFIAKVLQDSQPVMDSASLIRMLASSLNQGLLLMNDRGRAIFANRSAREQLGIGSLDLMESDVMLRPFGQASSSAGFRQEYLIRMADIEQRLPGQLLHCGSQQILVLSDDYMPPETMKRPGQKQRMVGKSAAMDKLRKQVAQISSSPSSVMVCGESGTGKEVLAQAIHDSGCRASRPFVAINCAAIPAELLESELFGHVKGAFTGASSKGSTGLIRSADGGTLFLDEIGDMPIHLQAKLLRVLEKREVTPVGSSKTVPVDIRVISATNQHVDQLIEQKLFRADLFYRLNVIPMYLPPLRERGEDILLLTDFFLGLHSRNLGVQRPDLTRETKNLLLRWNWPGNVRELGNLIEFLVNMVEPGRSIDTELLPDYFNPNFVRPKPHLITASAIAPQPYSQSAAQPIIAPVPVAAEQVAERSAAPVQLVPSQATDDFDLEQLEMHTISQALAHFGRCNESKQKAADALGIGIATLYRKIKKYQLED